ncbi:MAG: GTP-binding protein [Solobacterium sp.]|nr:GTP-binding protein [Solobacterium sp.]
MTKVNVVSGFLGAGKTTLISKLLKDVFNGQKVVLVENEYGEIGIDGGFLKEAGIEIREINSGCICCSLKGDFEEALKMLAEQYQPDHIIIEPSGVGKLSDILKAIQSVEGLELDSYSTVVDAARCKVYHRNFKEFFDDQIKTAASIVLSRTQNVSEEKLAEDIAIIRELNPEARIITTPWDELSGTVIFEAMTGSTNGFPEGLEDDDEEEDEQHEHHHHDHDHEHEHEHHHEHDHEHDHEHHHEHDHEHEHEHEHHHHHDHAAEEAAANEGLSEGNRIRLGSDEHEHHHHHHGEHDADEIFDSVGIETINRYNEEELRSMLSKLGENVIRAKGIVPDHEGKWIFFDYVPGDADIREGSPAYTGLITVIGEHVDIEEIKDIFGVH